MPSSFVDSVPSVMKLLIDSAPSRVVDIGPGYGKYGLMAREYLGDKLLVLDCVEVKEGRLVTQDAIYDQVFEADARTLPGDFWEGYDIALLVDVIEHMTIEEGLELLRLLRSSGCWVILSTPKIFEEQHDEGNPFEDHVSLWSWEVLQGKVSVLRDESTIDSIIYLLK